MATPPEEFPVLPDNPLSPYKERTEQPNTTYENVPLLPTVSDSIAKHRAAKYDFALAEDSPGLLSLRHAITAGREFQLRKDKAFQRSLKDNALRSEMLTKYLATKEGPITEQDLNLVNSLVGTPQINPDTFFEKEYARKFVTNVAVSDADDQPVDIEGNIIDESSYGQAMEEEPEQAQTILDAAEVVKAKNEAALKVKEDYEARWNATGWVSSKGISDTLELFVPVKSWWQMSNLLKDMDGPFMLGENLNELFTRLNLMTDVDQYNQEINRIAEELYSRNGYDAMTFLNGLIAWNSSDQAFSNLHSWLDLATPAPVVGVTTTKQWSAGAQKLSSALSNAIKKTSNTVTDPIQAIEGTGNLAKSQSMAAAKIASTPVNPSPNSLDDLRYEIPTLYDYGKWFGQDHGGLSSDGAKRLLDIGSRRVNQFWDEVAEGPVLRSSLEPDSTVEQAALTDIRDLMNTAYGQGSDVVIDVAMLNPERNPDGIAKAVLRLGNFDAQPFDNEAIARLHADEYFGIVGPYELVDIGGGKYVIDVVKNIDETAPGVRSARSSMMVETRYETPKNWSTFMIPYLKGRGTKVSQEYREEFIRATIGGTKMVELAEDMLKPLTGMSRRSVDRLEEFLNLQRDVGGTGTKPRGYFSEGYAQFEQDWYEHFKQLPSEREAEAYLTSRQLNDMQYFITNLAARRDQARKGIELWGFNGSPTEFKGALRRPEDIINAKQNVGIILHDVNSPGIEYLRKNRLNKQSMEELQEKLSSGKWRIVELNAEGATKYKAFLGDRAPKGLVNFVVTKETSTGPLPARVLPYHPGGHVALTDGYYVSSPMIESGTYRGTPYNDYLGDKNLFHNVSKAESDEVTKRLNVIREMYLKRDTAGIKAKLSSGYLPLSLKEVAKIFGGKKPKYDPRVPLYSRPANQSIEDVYKISGKYTNWTDSREVFSSLDKGGYIADWTQERGAHMYTLITDGSATSPTFKRERAKYISALPLLHRTTQNLFKDRYIGNIQHNLAENFIAEFSNTMTKSIDEIRADPMDALLNPSWNNNADKMQLTAAKNARRAALEILGMPVDGFEQNQRYWRDKLVKSVYDKRGQEAGDAYLKSPRSIVERAFYKTADLPSLLRSYSWDMSLGLFNPVQFFLQAMTSVHAIAVAGPIHGIKGVEAAMLHSVARLNEKHLKGIGKYMPGWKPEHLAESYEMAKRLGWYRVGREVGTLAETVEGPMRRSRFNQSVHQFRSIGRIFYNEGERLNRMVGWNAAYSEWRKKNPTAVFDDRAGAEVLARADDLTVNMTTASNAQWQNGWAGLPTQFMSYHARLMEQFMGVKLNRAEKIRAFLTYSAVYGLPVGISAPFAVWNFGDTVRHIMADNNISADENVVTKFLHDGLLSIAIELATGSQTSVADRIGPSGLSFVQDLLNDDMSFLEALAGASGRTVNNGIMATQPFIKLLVGTVLGGEASVFDMTQEDWWDLARAASSGDTAYNIYQAYNYERSISRKGQEMVLDYTVHDAIIKAFLGAERIDVQRAFARLGSQRTRESVYRTAVELAVKEYRRAYRASQTGDDATATKHWKRAQLHMDSVDLPIKHRRRAFRDGLRGYESVIESIDRRWAGDDVDRLQTIIDETNGRKGR